MSRVALARQHKKNFLDNQIDMVSYKDIKQDEYGDCKNLVIQVDSTIQEFKEFHSVFR